MSERTNADRHALEARLTQLDRALADAAQQAADGLEHGHAALTGRVNEVHAELTRMLDEASSRLDEEKVSKDDLAELVATLAASLAAEPDNGDR